MATQQIYDFVSSTQSSSADANLCFLQPPCSPVRFDEQVSSSSSQKQKDAKTAPKTEEKLKSLNFKRKRVEFWLHGCEDCDCFGECECERLDRLNERVLEMVEEGERSLRS